MSRPLLNILAALSFFLLALPGQSSNLWICVGTNGHIEISALAAHTCGPSAMHDESLHEDDHGDCLDTVLCRPSLTQLMLPHTRLQIPAASVSTVLPSRPTPPLALFVKQPPLSLASNLPLHHLRTIRLLI